MKKNTIMHYSLLTLSLYFCFKFYSTICIEIAILSLIFDLISPSIFINILKTKGLEQKMLGGLLIVIVSFNLLAVSSGFINIYNSKSVQKTINQEYITHSKKLNEYKKTLDMAKRDKNNLKSLDEFKKGVPSWENKTEITKAWEADKQKVNNAYNTSLASYNKELDKKISKYKTTKKQMGYTEVFNILSRKSGTSQETFVFILYMLASIVFLVLIFYTKLQSIKESKKYELKSEDVFKNKCNELNKKMQEIQIKAIEENFNKNILGNIGLPEKTGHPPIDNNLTVANKPTSKVFQDEILYKESLESLDKSNEQGNLIIENPNYDNVINFKQKENAVNVSMIKKYYEIVLNNSNANVAPGYKKVFENLKNDGISQYDTLTIFNNLKDKNYLKVVGRKTFIIKKEFKESDFEEVTR